MRTIIKVLNTKSLRSSEVAPFTLTAEEEGPKIPSNPAKITQGIMSGSSLETSPSSSVLSLLVFTRSHAQTTNCAPWLHPFPWDLYCSFKNNTVVRDLTQIFVSVVKVQIEAMLPLPLSTEGRDQSCSARVQGGSLLDKAVVSWIQCQAWNKLTSLTFIHQHAWNSPLCQVPCLAPGAQRRTYPHPLRNPQFLEELATNPGYGLSAG